MTIAGSDSSAGAGIQADLKTFSARGVYGVSALTCVVAETPGRVSRIETCSAGIVAEQINILNKSFPIAAVKTGLLCNAAIVEAVARILRRWRHRRLVIDPVMIATSGRALLADDAVAIYERELFPLAHLVTPNLDEAGRLLGDTIANVRAMRLAARSLAKKYGVAVLLKGGHLRGNQALDVLAQGDSIAEFKTAFVRNVRTHGTGCSYSAAITAELARGADLIAAIRVAKRFVSAAIRNRLVWRRGANTTIALQLSPRSSR